MASKTTELETRKKNILAMVAASEIRIEPSEEDKKKIFIAVHKLFDAYSKSDDLNRMRAYATELGNIMPAEIIDKAVSIVIACCPSDHYGMPYISDIVRAGVDVVNNVCRESDLKSFDEAWTEIMNVYDHGGGFSIPEIAKAASEAGWFSFVEDGNDPLVSTSFRMTFYRCYEKEMRKSSRRTPLRNWDDVWGEINKRMHDHNGSVPYFSTPEIRELVDKIGWREICTVSSNELGVLRAQMKSMYALIYERAFKKMFFELI